MCTVYRDRGPASLATRQFSPSRPRWFENPFFLLSPSRHRTPGAEITIACFMNVPLRYLLHRRAVPAACRCRLLYARQDRIANVKQADCPSPARVYIFFSLHFFSSLLAPRSPPFFLFFLFFDITTANKRRAIQRGLHRSSRAASAPLHADRLDLHTGSPSGRQAAIKSRNK